MAHTSVDKVGAARAAGRQLARFVRLVHRTSTVIAEPDGIIERLRHDHPCIVALWHGQFMMASMHRPDVPVAAMVARHGDAEFIGSTMEALGVELVRGAGAGDRKKDRGGARALRGALKCLNEGKSFVMTADVPPGPARRCGEGIITLAQLSGRPIVPLAVATSRFLPLDTWSRLTINLPFSKIAFVYGDPIFVPRDATAETLEELRLSVERNLNEVTRRAYALTGGDPKRATPRSADPTIAPPGPGLVLRTYRGLTRALSPVAPAVLSYRARRGKEDVARQPERLGHASVKRPSGTLAWLHAASVGELNAILPLIAALRAARPELNILVTSGTVTSAEIASRRLGPRATHQYAPIDTPQAIGRFLAHWRPDLAIFTESEIWPNLIVETSERNIPLALVNARMSARSGGRWRRRRRLAKQLFGRFAVVLAQNGALARQFAYLGAPRTINAGNLKIDAPPPPVADAELQRLKGLIGSRPILVAASTHEGEEEIVAQAHILARDKLPDLLTIIAPRHPERGAELYDKLRSLGLSVAMRSKGVDPTQDIDIYLADTIGELGIFYSLGTCVFLGGSLVERGGQNPIEAIRLNCAVFSGPSRHNFADIYRGLETAGAVVQVRDAAELAAAAQLILNDPSARERMQRGAEIALQHMGGALTTTLAALLPLLPQAPRPPSPSQDDPGVFDKIDHVQELRRAVS